MAASRRTARGGRSNFVAKGARPPRGLLLAIFGIPAALIVIFGILLLAKVLTAPEPVREVQDDAKLLERIDKMIAEAEALYRKAYGANTTDDPNAKAIIRQAKTKAKRLLADYNDLTKAYRDEEGSFRPGYEWLGAKGGRIAQLRGDIMKLKGF